MVDLELSVVVFVGSLRSTEGNVAARGYLEACGRSSLSGSAGGCGKGCGKVCGKGWLKETPGSNESKERVLVCLELGKTLRPLAETEISALAAAALRLFRLSSSRLILD